MTIASELNIVRYTGNGSTTVFPYTYKIEDEDHLEVIIADENDVQTKLTITTDYTVSGVGVEAGGNVTYTGGGTPLPSGHKIAIRRVVPLLQEKDFENQGDFFAEDLEDQLDYVTQGLQQLKEELDRCPKVSTTSGLTGDEFIEDINDSVDEAQTYALAASNSATAAQGYASDASNSADLAASLSLLPKLRTPAGTINGVNLLFTLAVTPPNDDSLLVFLDGLLVSKAGYTIGMNSITFGADYVPQTGQDLQYLVLSAGGGSVEAGLTVYGSKAAPIEVSAVAGLTVATESRKLYFLSTASGAVNITANPQISVGAVVGEELILRGTSDTNYPLFEHGTGLDLNGACSLTSNQTLHLVWDGTNWAEVSRRT